MRFAVGTDQRLASCRPRFCHWSKLSIAGEELLVSGRLRLIGGSVFVSIGLVAALDPVTSIAGARKRTGSREGSGGCGGKLKVAVTAEAVPLKSGPVRLAASCEPPRCP